MQVTLNRVEQEVPKIPLDITLKSNDGSGEVTYSYLVERLSNRKTMDIQLAIADMTSVDENTRNALLGGVMMRDFLKSIHPVGDTPEFVDIVDYINGDDLVALITNITNEMQKSTLEA